jgi:hypothetical protein
MNNIVYMCFGDISYKYELIYNLKSLFQFGKLDAQNQIIILCDDRNFFKIRLNSYNNVIIEEVSAELLEVWSGKNKFFFRSKICAIQYVLEKYGGYVLYLDADIIIIENINNFLKNYENKLFMYNTNITIDKELKSTDYYLEHMKEGNRDKDYYNFIVLRKKIYSTLMNNGLKVNEKKYILYKDDTYFNAGCIGIDFIHCNLLEQVLWLCDTLFLQYTYELSEELAFNLVFKENPDFEEINCAKYFFHYSSQDMKISRLLSGYIGKCLSKEDKEDLDKYLKHINIEELSKYNLNYKDINFFVYFLNTLNNKTNNDLTRFKVEEMVKGKSSNYLYKIKNYYKIFSMQEENHRKNV